ncbi:hypothetical protein BH09VER1_BH09VER1_09850 [soil metagenome]
MIRRLQSNERGHRSLRGSARAGAFTFVELIVAISIAAAVITTAAIVYGTVSRSNSRLGTYGKVTFPTGTITALYPNRGGTDWQTYFAPNYGRMAMAEQLRQSLYEDVAHATAVYCLARSGQSSIRPTTISIGSTVDARQYDTAEAFRLFLASAIPASASTFTSYRGKGTATNLSIFILGQSSTATSLTVRAIYELDFVAATSPSGTLASVRRFEGTTYTDYYDIFYPASTLPTAFAPTVVQFERSTRAVAVEGSTIDPFKVAAHRPFCFVWWPDPGMSTLEGGNTFTTYASSDPRSAYAGMSDRTSFFMVLPLFPAL